MHITANKRIFVITDSTISHSRLRCTHARIVRMMNSLAGFWKTSGIKMNISLGVGLSLEISSTCAGIVVIWDPHKELLNCTCSQNWYSISCCKAIIKTAKQTTIILPMPMIWCFELGTIVNKTDSWWVLNELLLLPNHIDELPHIYCWKTWSNHFVQLHLLL